jgi:hypothetical protein
MKTITEIVQKLLENNHITAEDAVVLLKAEVKQNPLIQDLHPNQYPPSSGIFYESGTTTCAPFNNLTYTTNSIMGGI